MHKTKGWTLLLALAALLALSLPGAADARCGEVLQISGDGGDSFRAALAVPENAAPVAALILLPGGAGAVRLDDEGCPRSLAGNSLVRSIPLFRAAGAATALADAPAEFQGRDGLGGHRIEPRHAAAIAALVRELRRRIDAPVWIVGTSRGAISAANAASRLAGDAAADGVVLTSPVTVGSRGALPWTSQSVFDLPLERIRLPLLVVGHEGDKCLRSPSSNLARIAAAASSPRKQVAVVTGGPGSRFATPDLGACEGREPHGFVEQEAALAAGILRFVRGGNF
ncbi:hypothetical protein [Desertibaculum subflavum]|uniref:hypothetical protein n=1 Tax=Desertibaculum subflavum TaxID=2268458 RepID=UPI0013C3F884